jgi:Protein of unknown function (DUF732)
MVVMTETTPEHPSETTAGGTEPPHGRWDKSHRRGGRPFRIAAFVVALAGIVYNSKTQRVFAALSAIAVAVGLATSTAPAAHADEHDDAFLAALKRHGIVPFGDPAGVVTMAHRACDQLAQGAKREQIVVWLSQNAPHADTAMFLREAALYYCPDYKVTAGWGG